MVSASSRWFLSLFLGLFLGIMPISAQRSLVAIVRYKVVDNPRFTFTGSPSDTLLVQEAPKKQAVVSEADALREYPGGFDRFSRLFDSLFLFSQKDWEAGFAGRGFAGFTIDTDGRLIDIAVVDSLTPAIDDEVARVLANLPPFFAPDSLVEMGIIYDFDLKALKWKEEAEKKRQIIDTLKPANAFMLVQPRSSYGLLYGTINTGINTDSLANYLRFGIGFSLGVDYVRHNWHYGFHLNSLSSRLKQTFERDGYLWLSDTAVRVSTVAFKVGRVFSEDTRFRIEPYVFLPIQWLRVADQTPDTDIDDIPSIFSFFPNLGINIDYKYKQKVTSDYWGSHHLNNTALRFSFSVNPANFRQNRRGTILNIGVGLSFHQRPLSIRL